MAGKVFYGWYIVGACFVLCMLYAGAGFYSFSIFIQPVESDFGWGRGTIALAMSIHLFVGGFAGPPIGKAIMKFGPKKVMLACALGLGACFILLSMTFSLWYFYLMYAFLAVAACGIEVIPTSTLMASWFGRLRGTATGIALVGFSTGGLVLAPLIGVLTAHYGWKAAFMIIGLVVWLLALPLIHFVVKDNPEEIGELPDGKAQKNDKGSGFQATAPFTPRGWPAKEAFRTRAFFWIFISFFLTSISQMGILQHQVPLFMDMGVAQTTAAAALGLIAGVGGVGKIFFGRISDLWQFKNVVLLCFGLQAVAVLMLLHINIPAITWIYAVIYGFSMGGIMVLMPMAVAHFWGLVSYGVILGVILIGHSLGGALGSYFGGLVYDFFGDYRLALYSFVGAYIFAIASFFLAKNPVDYPGEKSSYY